MALEDTVKRVDDRVTRIEYKVDGAVRAAILQENVKGLAKERDTLRSDISHA